MKTIQQIIENMAGCSGEAVAKAITDNLIEVAETYKLNIPKRDLFILLGLPFAQQETFKIQELHFGTSSWRSCGSDNGEATFDPKGPVNCPQCLKHLEAGTNVNELEDDEFPIIGMI